MRRTGGFSLIETMAATALLAIVLTIAYNILVPILHIWQRNRAQGDMEQAGLILQTRLLQDMRPSDAASLTTITSPPAFSFLSTGHASMGGYDTATGRPVWQTYVCYCLDTENQVLYRKEWPNPTPPPLPVLPVLLPTDNATPLTTAQLQALATTENGTETRAAWYVSNIAVAKGSGAWIDIDVQMSIPATGGDETADHQFSVEMRN